ncbi:MAG TPA: flagellar motor protein MotD [Xanthomonadaceae bacterium]|nr:flagellar motor protein MotD [Xanthomonadaceae bacterium]
MARRGHQHEEHLNHEAWAIPYGDLITLLLAFFVVMYAVSSINEGKYRVMADALSSAFGGTPHSISPIQLGEHQLRGSAFDRPSVVTPGAKASGPTAPSPVSMRAVHQVVDLPTFARGFHKAGEGNGDGQRGEQLRVLGERLQHALSGLVERRLVTVRRAHNYLEVEIQSDVLFDSGIALPDAGARATIAEIADILRTEPNAVRVEGYTDDQPIHTLQFDSNWELSAARAASVVHVMIASGVAPSRLAVVGYGDQQPVADNATAAGRNANRRVLLVILAAPQSVDAVPDDRVAEAAARDPDVAVASQALGGAKHAGVD